MRPPKGTSWRVWAFVVITAALLSGPVVPRVLDIMAQRRHAAAQSSGGTLPVTQRLLNVSELQGRSSWELNILRNEIYARHGRRFDDHALQSYFDSQPWYRGTFAPNRFREDWLTPVERANATLIREYQASTH
jgi:hypothetical protein